MPKISVIVPCYNVAPYVGRCLDSLINQTLGDIEIICIDDKSTDNTLEILQEYAKSDDRIVVIAQKVNWGVSVARNSGLDIAKGEYIGFVDPDDYVDLDFYERLYNAATQHQADIAKTSLITVNINGIHTASRLNTAVRQDKLNFQYEFVTAIYKRDFINKYNLRFLPSVSLGEDVNWLLKTVHLANKIAVIDETSYRYLRREDSACSQFVNRSKIEKVCIASANLLQWTNEQPDISKTDYMNILRAVYNLLTNNIARATTQDKELIGQYIVDAYKNTRYKKDVLKKNFKSYTRAAIILGQIDKIIKTLSYKHKRYKLFGVLPVAKVLHAPKQEYKIILFDAITLFKCVRGQYKDDFYVCGIKVLKVTH